MYPCFTIFRVQSGVQQRSISSTTKNTVLGPWWPDVWGDRASPVTPRPDGYLIITHPGCKIGYAISPTIAYPILSRDG